MYSNPLHAVRAPFLRAFALLPLLALGAARPAQAIPGVTYTVNTTSDAAPDGCDSANCTLREAIAAANADGVPSAINFSTGGTIRLQSALPDLASDITITGPVGGITVSGDSDGDGTGDVPFFLASSGTTDISNVKFARGRVSNDSAVGVDGGSLITVDGGTLNLTSCAITNGVGGSGGGNAESTVRGGDGGSSLVVVSGSVSLQLCSITGNQAGNGGQGGRNAPVVGIGMGGVGGNVLHVAGGTMSISQCTIDNNTGGRGGFGFTSLGDQGNNGGAPIGQSGGTMTIESSTLSNNKKGPAAAPGYGSDGPAGINQSGGSLSLIQTTIANNAGWAIGTGGNLSILNSTISGNEDGIISFSTPLLQNSIIAGNTGTNLFMFAGQDAASSNNITSGDPKLAPLADNGGPTKTMALRKGSPAINGGSNAFASALTTDQRGTNYSRFVGTVDIGAFEFGAGPQIYVVNTISDAAPDGCDSSNCTLREAVIAANNDNKGSSITFDPAVFSTPRTITLDSTGLTLLQDVTITGPAAGVTIGKNEAIEVFHVEANVTASIAGLTMQGSSNGIANYGGTIRVANCTFLDSTAGVGNYYGSAVIINCTVSRTSTGLVNGERATALNCTFSGNIYGIANYYSGDPQTSLGNTIVAGNSYDFDSGAPPCISLGHNLAGNGSGSGFVNGVNGDQVGIDPKLASLADNGGTVETMALFAGSPAIDAGSNDLAATLATDARGTGYARVVGGQVDIGAIEMSSYAVAIKAGGVYSDTFREDDGANATRVTFTRSGNLSEPLTVEIRSSNRKEATVPATATFAKGSATVTVPVTAVNDDLVDGTKDVIIEMRDSNGTLAGQVTVHVLDVTKPALTARLLPAAFYEDDAQGPLVSVSHNLEDTSVAVPLTFSFTDAKNRLSAPLNPEIAAGTRTANIRLVTTASPDVEGSLPVNITVDDNAFKTDLAKATVSGIIHDRQAKLTMTATPSLISESSAGGRPNSTSIRITRNGSLKAPLEVTLTARTGADQVTFNTTATIPAGAAFVDVPVTANADGLPESSQQVALRAKAPGYAAGATSFIVMD